MTAVKVSALFLLAFSTVSAIYNDNISKQGKIEARLSGGSSVKDINAYPFVVSVNYIKNGIVNGAGQANVINKYFALTSGNVANNINTITSRQFRVTSNALDVSNLTSAVIHNISHAFPHPGFSDKPYYKNNIGLIKVCPGFMVSNFALLPSPNQLFAEGTPCVLVGWGQDLTNLMELSATLDSVAHCNTTAVINKFRPFNETEDICIIREQDKYTCVFDNGVGLFVANTVVGIQSMGITCNFFPTFADSQVNVAGFVQWITENSVY